MTRAFFFGVLQFWPQALCLQVTHCPELPASLSDPVTHSSESGTSLAPVKGDITCAHDDAALDSPTQLTARADSQEGHPMTHARISLCSTPPERVG